MSPTPRSPLTLRRLALALTTCALLACGGQARRTSDLSYDIRAYNEGLRWEKLPQAAARVHPQLRAAFLDVREEIADELRIDDFEVTRLTFVPQSKGEKADVQVKWTWHLDSEGIVRETTSEQSWQRVGKQWILTKEKRLRGKEMPGLAEAEDDPSDEGEDGAKGKVGEEPEILSNDAKDEASSDAEAALRTEPKRPTIAA